MANSPQEPRLDRRLLAFLGLLAVGFGGILAAVLYAVTVDKPWAKPVAASEQAVTEPPRVSRVSTREAGRAFRDGAPRPTDEEAEPFVEVFDDLVRAIDEQDVDVFLSRANREALIEQVNQQGPAAPLSVSDAGDVARLMVTQFVDNHAGAGETEFEFCRIRRTEVDGQAGAVVYTRRKVFNWERTSRQCWWLLERYGVWEVYDVADLPTGLRASTVAAECAGDRVPPKTLEALMDYVPKVLDDEQGKAWELLESLRGSSLPPALESYRCMIELDAAHRMYWRHAPGAFDEAAAKLESIAPRMPVLAGFRASHFVDEQRFDETLVQVDRYTRTLGIDPTILLIQGDAFAGLKRTAEAEAAYRRALADDPYSLENLVALAKLLPDEKSQEIAAAFRQIPESQAWFDSLARELLSAEELVDLEAVIAAFRELAPNDPNADFFQGSVLRQRKQYADAAEMFAAAFPRVQDEERLQSFVNEFVSCMLADLKAEDAYGRAPLSRHTFVEIANRLLYPEEYVEEFPEDSAFARAAGEDAESRTKRHDLYRAMASLHLPLEPDDPWLAYYDGQLCALEGRYDDAERIYAEAMKQKLDEPMSRSFRSSRLHALFQADKDQFAYENIGPAPDTFAQLAGNCQGGEHWDRLEKLIELHRQSALPDPMLDYWKGVLARAKSQHDEAIAAFQSYLLFADGKATSVAEVGTAYPYQAYQARDGLVRSLVKKERWDEALAETAHLGNDWSIAKLQLLVHAARRNVPEAEAAMARFTEIGGESSDIYDDEDLGPLLRGDEFAALRAKYPEPKPSPSAKD